MSNHFHILSCAILCLLVYPFDIWGMCDDGRLLNRPLDLNLPVEVRRADCFTFDGKSYQLDSLHFLLDATLPDEVVGANPYLFNDFKDASDNFVDGTAENPMVLYIAPYVYWIDDPYNPSVLVGKDGHEPFGMVVRCQNLHLVGLAKDAKNVVLASQRGQTQGAVGNFTMFDFHGDGLQVSNLTMGNFCNVDLDHPLSKELCRKKRSSTITQAHVAYCHGDRVVARNVRFVSRLNMNPLNGVRRILFDHCHFECTDDALTGNGVYLHCDFEFYGQKPFYTTHPAGAVMLDCDFHLMGKNSHSYFCKASGPVTLVDCRFHAPGQSYVGWTAYPSSRLRCYYSNVTMNGNPYVVDQEHPETSICLDDKKLLDAYKQDGAYNVCGLLAGDDGWVPEGFSKLSANLPQCTALRIHAEDANLLGGGKPCKFEINRMRHAGYAPLEMQPVVWKVQDGYEKILNISPKGDTCIVSSDYDEDTPVDVLLTASTSSGLQAAIMIHLEGKPLPEPKLDKKPKIKVSDGVAMIDYCLSPNDHGDSSIITWLISDNKDMSGAIPLATSNSGVARTCNLHWCHEGKWLAAMIAPRHSRSPIGKEQIVLYPHRLRAKDLTKGKFLETDFHDFSCKWQTKVKEGCWTVDGNKPEDTSEFSWTYDKSKPMWAYGEGFNGAVGMGLVQAQRGARLMFTPTQEKYEDMVVSLDVDPTKMAGQGFGSATGQYMDIGLKFDNFTLTGYALRIIRTIKYANAVDFLLVRYDNGKVTPITEPISGTCYRTGCHIKIEFHRGILKAKVFTDTPLPASSDPKLQSIVNLSATVTSNTYGGFFLQHTGSCGESTTMLHNLRIDW